MSEVKRYAAKTRSDIGSVVFIPSPNGKHVEYEDYAALQQKLDALRGGFEEAIRHKDKLAAELNALAAENAALKAGPQVFFAYGGDCGYEEFKTAEEAREFADEEIASYREQACDGWSDEVGGVVWGIVMQRATMTGLRPVEEGDNCAEGFTEWCDYTLLPNVETPATDAYLNSVRAEGVNYVAEAIGAKCAELKVGSKDWKALKSIVFTLTDFAAQLRDGKDGE